MKLRLFGCLFLLVMTAGLPSAAVEVIAPVEVQAGDVGVCVTEVEGGELLEIPIRVLGVLGPSQPKGDLVIIRLEHPRFEEIGVAAGMSGSPVYVRDRLLGALAFSWAFSSEPVAGVTPFVHMEGLAGDRGLASGAGLRPAIKTIATASREGNLARVVLDWMAPKSETAADASPVAIGVGGAAGFLGRDDWSAAAFRRLGWASSPAGGRVDGSSEGADLAPGEMVAGILVDGDAMLAAGGTVTEVRDGAVWAFGHPFLGSGDVSMPFARASVVTFLPSLAGSFKMFNVEETIGTLTSDRSHGVWGSLGRAPAPVPMRVAVAGEVFDYGLIDDPLLTSLLAGLMVSASQAVEGRTFGDQTVDLGLVMDFAGGESLRLGQVFAGVDSPAQGAAWVSAVVGYLATSVFDPPPIEGLRVEIDAANGMKGGTIIDVAADRRRLAPGETINLRVRLRRKDDVVETVVMPLRVPDTAAEGRMDVVVADGASWAAYDFGARPSRPASFADELRLVRRLGSAGTLVAAFERPGTSLVLPGGTVAAPIGVTASLKTALGPNLATVGYRVLADTAVEVEGPVVGAARIKLEIRERSVWAEEDSQ